MCCIVPLKLAFFLTVWILFQNGSSLSDLRFFYGYKHVSTFSSTSASQETWTTIRLLDLYLKLGDFATGIVVCIQAQNKYWHLRLLESNHSYGNWRWVSLSAFSKLIGRRTNNQGTVCFDSLLLLLVSVFYRCLCMETVFFCGVVLTVCVVILLVLHYVVFILCVCVFIRSVFYFMSVHIKIILDKIKFINKNNNRTYIY